jgi:hypothetical protein
MKVGEIYGRLKVQKFIKKRLQKDSYCKCLCVCGSIKNITLRHLKSGAIKSCGCLARELSSVRSRKLLTKHGEAKKGTPLYKRWRSILQRVSDSNSDGYERYQKRNIDICEEWKNDYLKFKEWSLKNGFKKSLQIDRIDNSKGYSPDNCRWVTPKVNVRNREVTLKIDGVPLAELAESYNIPYSTLWRRLRVGWTTHDALNKSVLKYRRSK